MDWDDLLSAPELSAPTLCKSLPASRQRFAHKFALIKRIFVIKRLLEQGQPSPDQMHHVASWDDQSLHAHKSRGQRLPHPGRKGGEGYNEHTQYKLRPLTM